MLWWEVILAQSQIDFDGSRLLVLTTLTLSSVFGKSVIDVFFNKVPLDPLHVVSCILLDL